MYVCIDLKTFYASVECCDRGLDPFETLLVVADPSRTDTTICLAISPAMKALGIRNRCRLYEIPEDIHPIIAPPRMKRYMEVSADIYSIYLRYVSPEDIHVYSIDECFINADPYLTLYDCDAKGFARMLMDAVLRETGIFATAGVGTNLFLTKVALDITAKHVKDGIGYLDDFSFKRDIWHHQPITDIWNIGPGIARRLAKYGAYDLEAVTRLDRKLLYEEFGANAEFLIDHAHGLEPCTIAEIQAYTPESTSIASGQVLPSNYTYEEALLVLKEMIGDATLDLIDRHMAAQRISLSVGYDYALTKSTPSEMFVGQHGKQNLNRSQGCTGGSRKLSCPTNSERKLQDAICKLFAETTKREIYIRRLNISFGDLIDEDLADCDLFTNQADVKAERTLLHTVNDIKSKFGKNALVKGISLTEKATARERNNQVGGHRA